MTIRYASEGDIPRLQELLRQVCEGEGAVHELIPYRFLPGESTRELREERA